MDGTAVTPQFEIEPPSAQFEIEPPGESGKKFSVEPPEVRAAIASVPRPASPVRELSPIYEHPADPFSQETVQPAQPGSPIFAQEHPGAPVKKAVPPRASDVAAAGLDLLTAPTLGAETGMAAIGSQGVQGARELGTPGKRAGGALKLAEAGTEALTPLVGPAALENPFGLIKGMATGTAASKGAGYVAKKAGATPEQQALAENLGFWAPTVVGSILKPQPSLVSTPEGPVATGTVLGGKAGVQAAFTPEGVTVKGKVGPFEGSKTFQRGPAAKPALESQTIEGEPLTREQVAEYLDKSKWNPDAAREMAAQEKAKVPAAVGGEPVVAQAPVAAPKTAVPKKATPVPKVSTPAEAKSFEIEPPKASDQSLGSNNKDTAEPKYKYRSTQANIPADSEAHTALETARQRISDTDLAGQGKDVGGNHLTVRYGLKGDDVEGVKKYLSSLSPFDATLGKTEKFNPTEHSEGAAVIQAPVEARELHEINSKIGEHGDFKESDFSDYKPHATIAYVKPEAAGRYTGMSLTAGKKFRVESIAVTDRNGNQEEVKLAGKPGTQEAAGIQGQPREDMARAEANAPATGAEVGNPQASQVERRANVAERKRVAEMSPEEMKKALLASPTVDLPNRRAFDEAGKSGAVAMSDADGLKAFNDKYGYDAGNTLLQAKAESLKAAGLDSYHDKGDEFLHRGASEADLSSKLEKAREILKAKKFPVVDQSTGVEYELSGLDFSHGSGQDLAAAEAALKSHKSEREARGERKRGELAGVTRSELKRPVEDRPAEEVAPPATTPAVVEGDRTTILESEIKHLKAQHAELRAKLPTLYSADSEAADKWLAQVSQDVGKLREQNADLLNAKSFTIRAKRELEAGRLSQARYDELQKDGKILDEDGLDRANDAELAIDKARALEMKKPSQVTAGQVNDLMRQINAKQDELARLRGEPTRAEKRDAQKQATEKSFRERPDKALKYGDTEQSQHWQVLEADFIDKRFQQEIDRYKRAIPEQEAKIASLGPKTGAQKVALEKATLQMWKKIQEDNEGRDPRKAQRFKEEYRKLVKEAVSHGSPVPQEVISQHSEFKLAEDARERYDKGLHTSFANRSAAINDTMQKEEGFKVKRQDGKPITEAQMKEISTGVDEMAKVLGPELRDMMRGTDLTISHTSGKHPFLSDAGGQYHPREKSISAGINNFLGKPIKALAHETGHWLDFEAGRILNSKAYIRPKGGGPSTETKYVSEADRSTKPLYELARRTMSDTYRVQKLIKTTKLSDLPDDQREEIEVMKVVLGPYWHEPRELWARMFEQYVATKFGSGGVSMRSPQQYQTAPAYWPTEAWAKIEPMFEEALKARMDAMRERYAPTTIQEVSKSEPAPAPPPSVSTSEQPVTKTEQPPVSKADKSNPEFGQAKRELYPGKTDLSDAEVMKVIDRAAEIAKQPKPQSYEQWVAGGRKGLGPMEKAKAATPPGASEPINGVEKISKSEAEQTFDKDVQKRAAKLRERIDKLEKESSAPAATFQDSAKNASVRAERSDRIKDPHEVTPPDPGKLPDAEKNKYAFQREYFTQSLQPVVEAWKAHLGPGYANAAKNGVKGKITPPDFPEKQVLVNIPGDGHFKVNNDPKVLEKVIRGAKAGFAKPSHDVAPTKPPRINTTPSEPAKLNYLKRMADEAIDANTQEEKDNALETIENLLGFTPMKTVPKPGSIVEYQGERYYTNGVAREYRKTVNVIPEDSEAGRETLKWANAGRPKDWGKIRLADLARDAQEEVPLYLLKPVGELPDAADAKAKAPASVTEAEPAKVVPGARSAFTGKETGTSTIQDLTGSIKRQVGEKTSLRNRLSAGATIGEQAADAKDAVGSAMGKLQGAAAALWDAYARPPKWSDYEDATGKWSGADQVNALDLERFTDAIKKAVPEKLKREAISNWIEAGGDDAVLRDRAAKSSDKYKPGYEAALNLNDAEKTIARNVMNRNDATLEEAQKAGLLREGVENYVRHIYEDNPKMVAKVAAEMNFNSLQTKPSFTKQRKLPTYFDAEQLGFKPKDKDVGFLTASHERAFREALAARDYVKALMEGEADDGRPLVATSWATAKELPASEGEGSEAYLVKPNIRPDEEFADYRRIDHPALRGWRWAGKTEEGAPIFVQGDALVHPDIYAKLRNNLGKSAIRSFQVNVGGHTFHPGAALLNVSSEIKHAILSFSGFHQTTLGIHALEHRTAPIGMPELDLTNPQQKALVDHGLMVAQYDAMEAFGEGLASGGLITKIPLVGPLYHTYVDYLFKDYLPRVKMAMAMHALDRNTRVYGKNLSSDQIASMTAGQANAAFGGLNYKMLGRNKTLQDTLRLAFMAPDFTEARARFAGQAAKPYGREQLVALLAGAMALYATARMLNEMLDKDPHWDKPFSLVYAGKEFSLRTVQGDVFKALTEPSQFVRNRLSPLASTSVMAAEGRDRFGKKQSLGELAKDVARNQVPIPIQSWTKQSNDTNAQRAVSMLLKMVGVNEAQAKTKAEKVAADIYRDSYAGDRAMTAEQRQRYLRRHELIDAGKTGDWKPLAEALKSGEIDEREANLIRRDVKLGPLASKVNSFKYADFLKVYNAASPAEKKQLDPVLRRKQETLMKQGRAKELQVQ